MKACDYIIPVLGIETHSFGSWASQPTQLMSFRLSKRLCLKKNEKNRERHPMHTQTRKHTHLYAHLHTHTYTHIYLHTYTYAGLTKALKAVCI